MTTTRTAAIGLLLGACAADGAYKEDATDTVGATLTDTDLNIGGTTLFPPGVVGSVDISQPEDWVDPYSPTTDTDTGFVEDETEQCSQDFDLARPSLRATVLADGRVGLEHRDQVGPTCANWSSAWTMDEANRILTVHYAIGNDDCPEVCLWDLWPTTTQPVPSGSWTVYVGALQATVEVP